MLTVENKTRFDVENLIRESVRSTKVRVDDLKVIIKYASTDAMGISQAAGFYSPESQDIHIWVNPFSNYSSFRVFKLSTGKKSFRPVVFRTAEQIILFLFLHELAHCLQGPRGHPSPSDEDEANTFALTQIRAFPQVANVPALQKRHIRGEVK